jgi:uncharacterized lipoprotein YajG
MSRRPFIVASAALLVSLGLLAGCDAAPWDIASQAPASAAAEPTAVTKD